MGISTKTTICLTIWGLTLAYFVACQPHFESSSMPDYTGYVVCLTIMAAVMLMIHNFSAPATLLGTNIIFVLLGVITHKQFFAGFATDAVVSTAALVIFADAVFTSGVLDVIVAPLLPADASLWNARLRLMGLGWFFSSFLNNTPVMAILLPVTESFAARSGYDLRSLLMPLSFAIFLGAMNTLVGSSCNMTALSAAEAVAKGSFENPAFLSPALVGVPVGISGMLFMTFFTNALIPSKGNASGESAKGVDSDADMLPNAEELLNIAGQPLLSMTTKYFITFRPLAPLWGKTLHETGLSSGTPEFSLVKVVDTNEFGKASEVTSGFSEVVISENTLLVFKSSAVGVAKLRRRRGLKICSNTCDGLGKGRRLRVLMEAVVAQGSAWIGTPVTARELTNSLKNRAAVVGIRQLSGEQPFVDNETKGLLADTELSDDDDDGEETGLVSKSKLTRHFKLEVGSLLLLETYADFAKSYPAKDIAMVNPVPGSKPPRWFTVKDKLRMAAIFAVLVAMVLSAACNILKIGVAAYCAVFCAIFLEVMTVQEGFKAIEGSTLVIIACSAGIGKAIEAVGVGEWLGAAMVSASQNTFIGLIVLFFCLLSVLGCFLNANALMVLVIPIAYSASQQAGVSFKPFFYLCMYMGSISSLNIPIARAVNLMILRRAPYDFADFARMGLILQLFCGANMILLLTLANEYDWWAYFN